MKNERHPAAVHASIREKGHPMKKTILLIDDNKYLLDVFVIRLTLSFANYRIVTARDGKRGAEILKTTPVKFVLTDLDMPEMNGFEFIDYARKHHPSIPVFAMASHCTDEVRERLDNLGVSECIEKPFLIEEVTRRIVDTVRSEAGLAMSGGRQKALANS